MDMNVIFLGKIQNKKHVRPNIGILATLLKSVSIYQNDNGDELITNITLNIIIFGNKHNFLIWVF